MSRIVHISQVNPEVNRGGVSQFGRDLKLAVPELEFLHGGQDWVIAEALNLERLETGHVGPDTVVVADGYYGGGLAGKVKELIVVAHGTYGGWLRDAQRRYLPEFGPSIPLLLEKAQAQEKVFREADKVIAVSTLAQEELWTIHGVDSEVVLLGVDTDEYHHAPADLGMEPEFNIACVAGADKLKGADIIARLRLERDLVGPILDLGFDGKKSDRWRRHHAALFPSRHEGGGYALLEAMATSLIIVSGRTGFLVHDVPQSIVCSTDDYYWETFLRMLDEGALVDHYASLPAFACREWVMRNATIEMFIENWQKVLGT